MKIYAVIPTHNRHAELAALLTSIPADVHVLVIDNASDPSVADAGLPGFWVDGGPSVTVLRDEEQPPNLSRLWNVGLDWAHMMSNHDPDWRNPTLEPRPEYAVAILNDDVVLPTGFLGHMADALERHGVDIAFPAGEDSPKDHVNRRKGPVPLHQRMTGWCFVVRGSAGLRADERLRWWCGDDDLEQQALQGGRGTVSVSPWTFQPEIMRTGMPANNGGLLHRYPDQSTTGVLREQTEKDMTTFVEKWGQRPW